MACDVKVFSSKKERNTFVDENSNSEVFKYSELPRISRNITKREFYDWLDQQQICGTQLELELDLEWE